MALLDALVRLAARWWQADRIRLSPAEGRLLRLMPPCYLRIGEEVFEVSARRASEAAAGVVYDCFGAHGQAQLRVVLTHPGQPPAVTWFCGGAAHPLASTEITVYSSDD